MTIYFMHEEQTSAHIIGSSCRIRHFHQDALSIGRSGQITQLSEQASSLIEKRKGMRKLLTLIKEQAVEVILIEDPDRLVRFGCSYLEEACSWQGVRLEVLDPPKQLEPTEALVQDLLTIVTVFAGRLYGQRAKGVRKLVQTALKECETEHAHGTRQQND